MRCASWRMAASLRWVNKLMKCFWEKLPNSGKTLSWSLIRFRTQHKRLYHFTQHRHHALPWGHMRACGIHYVYIYIYSFHVRHESSGRNTKSHCVSYSLTIQTRTWLEVATLIIVVIHSHNIPRALSDALPPTIHLPAFGYIYCCICKVPFLLLLSLLEYQNVRGALEGHFGNFMRDLLFKTSKSQCFHNIYDNYIILATAILRCVNSKRETKNFCSLTVYRIYSRPYNEPLFPGKWQTDVVVGLGCAISVL